jgi:GNAT superfamily N-acetyltransferase
VYPLGVYSRALCIVYAVEISDVTGGEVLHRWHAVMKAANEQTTTVDGYVDWLRQGADGAFLLGTEDGDPVAAAFLLTGWYSPPHVCRADVRVAPSARGRGHGDELLRAVSAWAAERGKTELTGDVREDDPGSLAWAEARGFREIGRNSRLVLDLTRVEAPAADPPSGIEIVPWSERPDAAREIYEVMREAHPDIPGEEEIDVGTFEEWLERDMRGIGDSAEAVFVALAGDDVVGYAKLSFSQARERVVMHDLTAVRRAWRGRGIAASLKRTQIAWAKEHGYERLETSNEVRNEPIRRLNERHGYVVEPGEVTLLGPLAR